MTADILFRVIKKATSALPIDVLNSIGPFTNGALVIGLLIIFANQSSAQLQENRLMDVSRSWSKIERWLGDNAPAVREKLNPPASVAQIERIESALGMRLPPSVRHSYLIHDGESRRSAGLFGLWRWLPLEELLARHAEHKKIDQENGFDRFRPNLMIPLVESPGGDMLYVEASELGLETPVIEWWHEEPTRDVEFPSFAHMLEQFAARLERDEYVFRPELLGLVDKEDI